MHFDTTTCLFYADSFISLKLLYCVSSVTWGKYFNLSLPFFFFFVSSLSSIGIYQQSSGSQRVSSSVKFIQYRNVVPLQLRSFYGVELQASPPTPFSRLLRQAGDTVDIFYPRSTGGRKQNHSWGILKISLHFFLGL